VLAGAAVALFLISACGTSFVLGGTALGRSSVAPQGWVTPAVLPPGADSSTYLGNNNRDIFGPQEKLITGTTSGSLHLLWSFNESGAIESTAVTSAGLVYIGSTNGYEYALNSLTGAVVWKTFVGLDRNDTQCGTAALGVISTPTVSGNTLVLYGGDAALYDLNKLTGHVQWRAQIGNTTEGYFGWGSPLLVGGYAYIGAASRCDKPLIPGGLYKISLSTHKVVAFLNTTAPGLVGNSIWSTPSYNSTSNTIFVTTGNQNGTDPQGRGESILAINASSMQLRAIWGVPAKQQVADADFGSTPTLFTPKGGYAMVCAANKNGILYAWYQSNLTLAWEVDISSVTTISSVSFSGSHLYVLGPNTTIKGVSYPSAVRELNPLTGAVVWQDGLSNAHTGYASPLWSNGALVVAESSTVEVLSSSNGKLLTTLSVTGKVNAPPTVSRGELYVPTTYGYLEAFDIELRANLSAAPVAGGLSLHGLNFSAQGTGGLPAYAYNWSFGDGAFASGAGPSHFYSAAGSYTVDLTITDLAGTVATAVANETVS
jgi:outer membrane protein assembly factor BamB